jgi:hypothetical protein
MSIRTNGYVCSRCHSAAFTRLSHLAGRKRRTRKFCFGSTSLRSSSQQRVRSYGDKAAAETSRASALGTEIVREPTAISQGKASPGTSSIRRRGDQNVRFLCEAGLVGRAAAQAA